MITVFLKRLFIFILCIFWKLSAFKRKIVYVLRKQKILILSDFVWSF